jgi:ATP-dependent DNA ligase
VSRNRPGFRSPDWLKVPIRHREEFVVAGYLPSPRGFSTLILGQFNREGNFAYVGFCGTGLSETTCGLEGHQAGQETTVDPVAAHGRPVVLVLA